jgi:phenylacetate-coenzyme A ligase PaaK-like adenylate-forming protein
MTFVAKRRVYESLPAPAKRLAGLIPFFVLAGRAYRETCGRLRRFDEAGPAEIRAFQESRLAEILEFAVSEVPAYRPLRSAVARLKPFEALAAFPLLDRDTLLERREEYLPRNFHRIPHYAVTTGGTGGRQLSLFVDDCSQSVEMGFMHRLWLRVGYTPKHRKATFRGVPFPNLGPGVFWHTWRGSSTTARRISTGTPRPWTCWPGTCSGTGSRWPCPWSGRPC